MRPPAKDTIKTHWMKLTERAPVCNAQRPMHEPHRLTAERAKVTCQRCLGFTHKAASLKSRHEQPKGE